MLSLAEFERRAVILRAEAFGVIAAAAKADALRDLRYAFVGLRQIVNAARQAVVDKVLKRCCAVQALEYAAAFASAYVRGGGDVLKGYLFGVIFLNKSAQNINTRLFRVRNAALIAEIGHAFSYSVSHISDTIIFSFSS